MDATLRYETVGRIWTHSLEKRLDMTASRQDTSTLLLSELDFTSPIIEPLALLGVTTVGEYLLKERGWLVGHKGITRKRVDRFNRELRLRDLDPRRRNS